jgi:hypothetical protein
MWIAGFTTWSLEPIKKGDAMLAAYSEGMYAIAVDQILFPRHAISCRIARVPAAQNFPTKIALEELGWKLLTAREKIRVGSRSLRFSASVLDQDDGSTVYYLTIEYDECYGRTWGRNPSEHYSPTHIAIVHTEDLDDNAVVDLTKFRFKTWEDGLGNRCDSTETD